MVKLIYFQDGIDFKRLLEKRKNNYYNKVEHSKRRARKHKRGRQRCRGERKEKVRLIEEKW